MDKFEAASATATARAARSDGPGSCASDLARGMCLCASDTGGSCAAPTTPSGVPWYKTQTTDVSLFASDGACGATRVPVYPVGRGG